MAFLDQNGRPFETEDKATLKLLINRIDKIFYRRYVKGYGFLSFGRKYRKKLLDTWIDAVTTASKFCQKREEILNELRQVL